MQQVVQGALSFLGLNGQQGQSNTQLFDTLGLETVSRPLSLPTPNGVSLLDASLLAWLLLLQRERGEDDQVENFNWGRRTADGAETSSQFSIKTALGSEGLDQTASVKNVLEALKKVTGKEVTEENRTLFFNDGKEAPEKIKEEGYETAQRPVCLLSSQVPVAVTDMIIRTGNSNSSSFPQKTAGDMISPSKPTGSRTFPTLSPVPKSPFA